MKSMFILTISLVLALSTSCHNEIKETNTSLKGNETKSEQNLQGRITKLLKELDENDHKIREKATEELIKIGKPALQEVEKTLANTSNPEIKLRAKKVIQYITIGEIIGEYYFGDGMGENCTLHIKIDGTFDFTWEGCLGTYDENKGPIEYKDEQLILNPERLNIREGFRGTPTEFLLVKWGDRRYLIPKDDMLKFCNAINQGDEPRDTSHGYFYLLQGDWKKKIQGFPQLSQEWSKFLLKDPVKGKITELLDGRKAKVNLGSKDGIYKGMILTVRQNPSLCQVRVISVEEHFSIIEPKYNDYKISEGETVTSRFHDE